MSPEIHLKILLYHYIRTSFVFLKEAVKEISHEAKKNRQLEDSAIEIYCLFSLITTKNMAFGYIFNTNNN